MWTELFIQHIIHWCWTYRWSPKPWASDLNWCSYLPQNMLSLNFDESCWSYINIMVQKYQRYLHLFKFICSFQYSRFWQWCCWRFKSFEMLCCINYLTVPNASEECSALAWMDQDFLFDCVNKVGLAGNPCLISQFIHC